MSERPQHMPLLSEAFDARSDSEEARAWYGLFVDAHDALASIESRLRKAGHPIPAATVMFVCKTLDGIGAAVVGGLG